jgi:hypothetical protein
VPAPSTVATRRTYSVVLWISQRSPIGSPEDRLPAAGQLLSNGKPPRKRVTVKYYKKRPNRTWKLLDTKRPRLNRKREFHTEFQRHTVRRTCKVTARYPGAKNYSSSRDTLKMKCASGEPKNS